MGTYQLIDRTLETKVEGTSHSILWFQVQFFYRDIFTFFSNRLNLLPGHDFQLIRHHDILEFKLKKGWCN